MRDYFPVCKTKIKESTINAHQKLKREILIKAAEAKVILKMDITDDNVDLLYDTFSKEDTSSCQDFINDMREGQFKTDIPSEFLRNYDSDSVAMKLSDGSWIGWTFWHGGGKHSNPEEIPWMEHAYDLDVAEKEEMVVVRTFKKKKVKKNKTK